MSRFFTISLIITAFTLAVNGDSIDYQYSYMAFLRDQNNSHLCGGAIISNRHILTADDQCFKGKNISDLVVVTGTDTLTQGGTVRKIKSAAPYRISTGVPSRETNAYGIVVITLSEPLESTDLTWRSVKLPSHEYSSEMPGVVLGWGATDANSTIRSEMLLKMDVDLADVSKCQVFPIELIAGFHICTLPENGQGICDGDYGGPLVVNEELVGIASFTGVCGQSPSVYLSVFPFLNSITMETRTW